MEEPQAATAAAETIGSTCVEKLERAVWHSDLHRTVCSVRWSLHCGFCADLGIAVQDSKPRAAAAGPATLRVEVVSGAGGAHDPGPTRADPGGGESLTLKL